MSQQYWHLADEKEIDEFKNSSPTVAQLDEKYKQPDWCSYQNALYGQMGCWSLVGDLRTKISEDFCKDCECFLKLSPKIIAP